MLEFDCCAQEFQYVTPNDINYKIIFFPSTYGKYIYTNYELNIAISANPKLPQ